MALSTKGGCFQRSLSMLGPEGSWLGCTLSTVGCWAMSWPPYVRCQQHLQQSEMPPEPPATIRNAPRIVKVGVLPFPTFEEKFYFHVAASLPRASSCPRTAGRVPNVGLGPGGSCQHLLGSCDCCFHWVEVSAVAKHAVESMAMGTAGLGAREDPEASGLGPTGSDHLRTPEVHPCSPPRNPER